MKEPAVTDSAAAYAPPGVRRTGAPSRPADPRTRLHVVPEPKSEVPTSGKPQAAPTPSETAAHSGAPSETGAAVSDLEFRVRAAGLWTRSRTYWTPPAVFTARPASLADLAEYAKHAPWTHQQTGIVRAFGVGYYRSVGYPYTVVSRYREWIAQRPARLLVALGGIKLAASTGPGIWVVDHLIYPAARLAGHIFL
jgi:hypothetical protein